MLIRRRVQSPPEDATDHLLTDLLGASPDETRLRPVQLRSVKTQRRSVLAPYPLRTWFDRVLTIAERGLGIVVVLFFGWWLLDGYGRDWWHVYQVETVARSQPAPVAVASVAASAAAEPQPHPELGASLPVVEERWTRPSVEIDYLVPARTFVAPLQPTPTPEPAVVAPVDLRPTQLTIPSIDLESNVVEVFLQDNVWQVADYAVGYHHDTGIVGASNVVLAGHKGLRGGVFRRLEQVKPGDDIIVTAAGQRFQYRVRTTGSVWPNQVDVMFPTQQPQITLLTCTNWDTQRFIVVADFVGPMPDGTAAGGK